MQDPFNSEYVSSVVTGTSSIEATKPLTNNLDMKSNKTIAASPEPVEFGFEPARYGLGKPKRVIIRGKITRG